MFRYKTAWCKLNKDSHDSKKCIFAHHMRDFRRPYEIFKYAKDDCEVALSPTNYEGWFICPNGILCKKCHTKVEKLYHPDNYKKISCDHNRCNK